MDEENEQDGYQPNFTEAATSPAMPPQPPQSPPTMVQQPPPPPPVPIWTAADDMDFATTSAGMRKVKADLKQGVLHPQFGLPLLQQYQDDLQGMSQEKMAFDQHQQQTATQAALGQAAMQQAVQIQNGQHAASAFPSLTARHVDEQGNVTNFYQHRPGEWKQIDRPAPDESAAYLTRASDAGSSADPYAGAQASADPAAGVGISGGDTTGEADRPIDQQPDAAAAQPFTQTIWNGTNRTDTTWQPGQTQGQSTGSWMGQPGGQPPIQNSNSTPMGNWYQQAKQGMRPEPPARVLDRFGRSVVNPDFVNYHKELDIHARNLHMDDLKRQADDRKEAARTAHEDAKAHAELTTKQLSDVETAERNRLTSAIHDHRLHTTDPTQVPDELKGPTGQYLTPSEIADKARQTAEDKVKWLTGRRGGGAQPAAQPGQQQPAAQGQAQPNQPVAAAQSRVYGSPKPATQQPTEPGEPKAGSYVDERSLPAKLVAAGERERVSDVGLEEVRRLGREAEDAFNNPSESEGHATMIPGGDMARRALGRLGVGSTSDVKSALNILKTAHDRGRGLTEPEKAEYQKVVARLPGTLQDRLKLRGPKPAGANERSVLPNG